MDKPAEMLTRSALHDLANVLAGIQGILDIADPERPLSPRDRGRLEAVVEEGLATLTRTRHLAMGTLPDALPQPGADWQAQLAEELKPMATLFKCQLEVSVDGSGPDPWPGLLLRSYVRAAVRQVLPYVHGGTLAIRGRAEAEAWLLDLAPVAFLPEALLSPPQDVPGDIASRWAAATGEALGLTLSCEHGTLSIRVPRHAEPPAAQT